MPFTRYTPNERARIQAISGCSERTIRRYEQGLAQHEATRLRIERAAAELRIAPAEGASSSRPLR